jgi:CRISPR-associated protein Cas1
MVVRAAVARAVCGAGLHPSLGLHHSNKYNAFALADDLLEPLRPLVDRTVQRLVACGQLQVDAKTKPVLLGLLAGETAISGPGSGPLLVAIERYASSLAAVFSGESTRLEIPDVFAPAAGKEEKHAQEGQADGAATLNAPAGRP